MAAPLLTYRDAYEHLLDVYSQVGKAVGAQDRRIRRAVTEAYRLLPSLHDWKYFKRWNGFNTETPDTFTDATYDASELTVTLATSTWASNAKYGSVNIEGVGYPVSRRTSASVVALERGPAADFSGSVTWRRHRYLLPVDVGRIREVFDTSQDYRLAQVPADVTYWWSQLINSTTLPLVYSVIASPDVPGRWEMWLSGAGDISRQIEYQYSKRHAVLDVDEVNTGTVSIAGDVATFSSSVLDSAKHVGCVLRVSSDSDVPTSVFGKYYRNTVTGEESELLNPPAYEVLITAVNSATEAIIGDSITTSSKGYTISSHIDVNYEGMWEMFLRLCEEQYGIITRADTAIRNVDRSTRLEAMRSAMAADATIRFERHAASLRGEVIVDSESS